MTEGGRGDPIGGGKEDRRGSDGSRGRVNRPEGRYAKLLMQARPLAKKKTGEEK